MIRRTTQKHKKQTCVGIITIPHSRVIPYGNSHIMKPYVDWFESRGVRVLPIPYDTKEHELYFYKVNGLFIPGGETTFILKDPAFVHSVTRFVELSLQKEEYFPIWGTCFGFQMLLSIIGGMKRFHSHPNHDLTSLSFTKEGKQSKIVRSFSKQYVHYMENNKKSTSNNNEYGISPSDFEKNPHLRRFYTIVSTSTDETGKEYVSTIEGKYYPVYGVQWHPERQTTTGPWVDFFISELKKNKHVCHCSWMHLDTRKCIQYPEHKQLTCYFF